MPGQPARPPLPPAPDGGVTGGVPAAVATLLSVEDLSVSVAGPAGRTDVVHGVSFTLAAGETLGLVGESGCGKSLTALSIARLLPAGARIASGRVVFEGEDLVTAPDAALRRVRGARIGFVFQEPSSALNPVYSVGAQIAETLPGASGHHDR